MMFRSFLLLPLLIALSNAQIVFQMNVCFDASATSAEAQAFCESVPECGNLPAGSTESCFKRCEDVLEEDGLDYDCGAEGLKCHHGLVCVVPPKMIEDLDDFHHDEFDKN
mmetsp:Transcript_30664/g.50666  ORF Transcript_30664/g.50666 Transcript_30664/m.50666 type:complete len:110 (-) Transcript_30664:140-469(-)|eukprot:CAMPEP_0119008074 /NCGR_PEP_ID=MMETSP1176-20130426/3449_1 /TAXON_ID=265551 /ORGANISM="Synedropsis recta cf, Strain CCMP1620" /LENGTH=109 /DNA_ID=CAMNT_0006960339 /DNA_START=76 /DNA_END=405 /DNA_ORIENTATION=-